MGLVRVKQKTTQRQLQQQNCERKQQEWQKLHQHCVVTQ